MVRPAHKRQRLSRKSGLLLQSTLFNSASPEISTDYNQAAEYVEKNGLLIYGFAAVVKKEDAQRILKADNTYSISVTELV